MYCENCGKEIEEDARFCKYCGVLVGYTIEQDVNAERDEKVYNNQTEEVRVEAVVENEPQAGGADVPQKSKAVTIILASAVGGGAIFLLILLAAIMFHYKSLAPETNENWLRDYYEDSYSDDDSYDDEDSYSDDDSYDDYDYYDSDDSDSDDGDSFFGDSFFDDSDKDDFSGGEL